MIYGLLAIMLLVFILPFAVKKIEEELEIFLFIMGVAAVTVTKHWDLHLVHEALVEPIKITMAVFAAGLLFKQIRPAIANNVNRLERKIGLRPFVFLMVVALGLLASVITAIVAALVLVEIVGHLKLDRKTEIRMVVLSCFSIGFGAALTPIGEPLSTIAISKLKGAPHYADFWYLVKHLGAVIVPSVITIGLAAVFVTDKGKRSEAGLREHGHETLKAILLRTGKIYLFIMALVFLGSGFKPLIDEYVSKIPFFALYWINILSAVLDNATLVAAEIGPSMDQKQINAALLGLIVAGGILIPGNIPNIISASKLKIKSKEWASIGVPFGLSLMAVFFILIMAGLVK
jgi:predicted cation transporter